MDDLDDLSFEEDFSETQVFESEDEPKSPQRKEVTIRNSAFEILTIEKIVENVMEMVGKVQNFLGVGVHCAMDFSMFNSYFAWKSINAKEN